MMDNLQPEIKTLDDLAEWCAMPNGEQQNYIAWCFKTFANFTDYIDHTQHFCHMTNAIYIRYNAIPILEMSFQCDKQAAYKVRSTGSTK